MSRSHDRHDGVSCDGCHTENFRCARYKCLVCFDYDLCAHCFEAGSATQRHTPDHPMQCILTRADHELYYGGESLPTDQPQSFACPFCRNLGFTETSLQEHVATEHSDAGGEVVCPVCAATPSGEPNHMTDDLANHLSVDHLRRNEFSHEESRLQRRMPPPGVGRGAAASASGTMLSRGRGRGTHHAAAAAGFSAFARESADPIAELLSQLGGIRRAGASAVSQIQQLQQQVSRQAPRRTIITTIEAGGGGGVSAGAPSSISGVPPEPASFVASGNAATVVALEDLSRLQLPTLFERNTSEEEKVALDVERTNRSLFVQELLLSTFMRPVRERSSSPVEDGLMKNAVSDSEDEAVSLANKLATASVDSTKNETGEASPSVGERKLVIANGPPHNSDNGTHGNGSNNDGANSARSVSTVATLASTNNQGSNAQTRGVVQNAPSVRVTATMQRHPSQAVNSQPPPPSSRSAGGAGATSSGQL